MAKKKFLAPVLPLVGDIAMKYQEFFFVNKRNRKYQLGFTSYQSHHPNPLTPPPPQRGPLSVGDPNFQVSWPKNKISSPKASNGQRFPCPALLSPCFHPLGLAGWASGLAGWPRGGGRMYGRRDGRTNVQKISPFYRTSSPIGAAALPPPMKTKEKVEQGKGTADHLMPLRGG